MQLCPAPGSAGEPAPGSEAKSAALCLSFFWMSPMIIRPLVASLLLLVAIPVVAQPPATPTVPLTAQLPVDPAVRMGTLPNGMRYYIRQNGRPEKRAELRLVVNAGSVLEDDDQLGRAQFL